MNLRIRCVCIVIVASIVTGVLFIGCRLKRNDEISNPKKPALSEKRDGAYNPKKAGEIIKDVFSGVGESNPNRVVGYVDGKPFSAAEIEIWIRLGILSGDDNPLDSAADGVRYYAYLKKYAEKYNIIADKKAISNYIKQQRNLLENIDSVNAENSDDSDNISDDESAVDDVFSVFMEATGMTPDEYWNNYVAQYEAPKAVLTDKVHEYNKVHNLPNLSEIDAIANVRIEITDKLLLKMYSDGKKYHK